MHRISIVSVLRRENDPEMKGETDDRGKENEEGGI